MEKELVDILVATYNPNIDFLKKQIDSLINQTHKKIKIIISDDASTKSEVIEELKKYAKKDIRIDIYLNKDNVGYLKNFEFLLNKSKANYIMFCDHDDIWYENKVEKSLEKIKNDKLDMVYVNAKQIDEQGNVLQDNYLKYKNLPLINGKNNTIAFSRHIAIGCSQIFTKEVKEKMLPFKKSVIAHDWINTYIADRNKGIGYIEEPLFEYRIHTGNVFGGRNLRQNLAIWKNKNGASYKSYLKYRHKSITEAYLKGAEMCNDYIFYDDNVKIINYYKKVKDTKIADFNISKFYKYLGFKGIGKRAIKELMLFHFPIISYIAFVIG